METTRAVVIIAEFFADIEDKLMELKEYRDVSREL